ncbi:MAG: hypothetical protein U0264_07120 [Candidatus Kapaibacterium sp.]
MTTNENSRDYSFSDGDLTQRADTLVVSLTTDLLDFADRGVTANTLTSFGALIADFQNTGMDVYYAGKVSEAVEVRVLAREALKTKLRTLSIMVSNTYGKDAAHYKTYGFGDLTTFTDGDFVKIAQNAARVAAEDAAALAKEGYSMQFETDLTNLIANFDAKIDLVRQAEGARLDATRQRIIKGNLLYSELTRLCTIGKDIYSGSNLVKYNSYLVYDSAIVSGVHGTPANIRFNGSTTLEWDAIDNATSYGVSVSTNQGTSWQTDINTSTNSTPVPVLVTGKLFYKVRGRNATGLGEYSAPFERLFGLESVKGFINTSGTFTWNAVEFASGYEIERAAAGTSNYTLLYNSSGTSFSDTPAQGNWTYRIRPSLGGMKGEWVELNVFQS